VLKEVKNMNDSYITTFFHWISVAVALVLIAAGLYLFLHYIVRWHQKQALGLALVSPWIIGFAVFTAGPLVYSLYLSFTQYSLFGNPKWVGLQNYINLFTHDPQFWPSVKLTMLYALITVPIGVVGSLLIAILMNQKVRGIGIFRVIFYLPAVLPDVAVALIWRWLFNGHGLFNYLLSPFMHIMHVSNIDWFGKAQYVLPAFSIMSIWGIFGANAVIFLAALQEVSKSYYEVADLDGATKFQKLWFITIPLISPIILLQIIQGIIGALQIFSVAMFVRPTTSAGEFMNQLIYERGFTQMHMGEASSIAWFLFAIILIFTLLIFKSSTAWVYYESNIKR
jgi:multiple sugar transport system permease protein